MYKSASIIGGSGVYILKKVFSLICTGRKSFLIIRRKNYEIQ